MDKNNEQDLIQKCVNGDVKAQKFLYEKYSRIMFGTCLRYSNTYEDAKDILQDGFIKVFTRISQFNYSGVFEGWMKRIFINTALEHYRVNKFYHNQSDIEDNLNTSHQNDFTIEKISQKEILVLLNSMPPGYRAVLNLYIIEGYNHAEIAEMMGITEGTSKSQLSRARILLQEKIIAKQKNFKNEPHK